MKKITISFFIFFLIAGKSFSWDSTAAKYYPLAIGNTWSYHHINWGMMGNQCIVLQSEYDIIKRIIGDTLMPNGKRYFRFSIGFPERIDSSSMNVYRYNSAGERIIDSLFARKNDYFKSYRSGLLATHQVNDTLPVIFSGTPRRGKQIYGNGLVGHLYTLVSGIGLYYEKYCELGGSTETLNGCIINGIQYGQIVCVEKSELGIPFKSQLSQNYPNPFNPVTIINYELPITNYVNLTVYDILGRVIANLINEKQTAGRYEVEWDGTNYPSGVYFYKLTSGEYNETRKMVLIK